MSRALYCFGFLLGLGVLASPGPAEAQVRLPYATRRLSFSGLGTTVRGDIRTVGMGGASAGLSDTFIAAIDNPAGLAMTVGIGDIHFTTFLGGYYEWSRILGAGDRLHGTFGVEARLWIFTIGAGIDIADQYRSYLVSFGVDVFGVMARLGMIPPFGSPPSGRMFPRPWQFSDAGLARPLTTGRHEEGLDPIAVGLGIPRNLGRGLRNAGVELRRIGDDLADAIETTNLTPEQRAAREEAERLRKEADERADRDRLLELQEAELAKQAEEGRPKQPTRKPKRRHRRAQPSR